MSQNFCNKSIGRGHLLSEGDPRTPPFSAQPAVLSSGQLRPARVSWILVSGGSLGWAKFHYLWNTRHTCPPNPFSYSSGSFCWTFQGDFTGLGDFDPCPGWIRFSNSEGSNTDGQFDPIRLVAWVPGSPCSSDYFERASFAFLPDSVGEDGSYDEDGY